MASLADILEQIDRERAVLKGLEPLKPGDQQRLDTKFRLEFNYNSNHIEGNTLTYGETELLLLFDQTKGDHELREYEEMKSHDVGLKMMHEEAVDIERPLTEQFIRQLNGLLLVRPFWKDAQTADGLATRKEIIPGQYKTTPNSVRLQNGEIFHYASPEETRAKMTELVEWFNNVSKDTHPLFLAALLHYQFVRIHPFDDGNGRVARLLMNYVLIRNNLPMIVIKSADKKQYLAALNRADAGDDEAFAIYLGQQLLWSLELSIKAGRGENIEEPDDLDKRIAVLAKGITSQKPSVKKTSESLKRIFHQSLSILISELENSLKTRFKAFYDHITFDFGVNGSITNLSEVISLFESLNEYDVIKLSSLKVLFLLNVFKPKISSKFCYDDNLEITFDDFGYTVITSSYKGNYSYDHDLTYDERKEIIDHIGTLIYTDIEAKILQLRQNN